MISGGIKSDQPCNSYEHCVTGAVILTGIGTKARTGTRFGLGPGPGPGLVWDRDQVWSGTGTGTNINTRQGLVKRKKP